MNQTVEAMRAQLSGADLTPHTWGPERACRGDEKALAAGAIGIRDRTRYKGGRKTVIDTARPEWKQLTWLKSNLVSWWHDCTFPYVTAGVRLFFKDRRRELWDKVAHYNERFEVYAARLDANRDWFVEEAKNALGPAYEEGMIPQSWKGLFFAELREVNIDPPAYLERDDERAYKQEVARRLEDLGASLNRFEQESWRHLARAAQGMLGMLGGDAVRGPTVEQFPRLFARVAQMRFEGTAVFKRALEEAKGLMDGVTAGGLREDKDLRAQTRQKLLELVARHRTLQELILKKALPGAEEPEQAEGESQG